MSRFPHIAHPYTHDEILAKIATDDYGAELMLQHILLVADRYREALEFYASGAFWMPVISAYGTFIKPGPANDNGDRARAALREEEK